MRQGLVHGTESRFHWRPLMQSTKIGCELSTAILALPQSTRWRPEQTLPRVVAPRSEEGMFFPRFQELASAAILSLALLAPLPAAAQDAQTITIAVPSDVPSLDPTIDT